MLGEETGFTIMELIAAVVVTGIGAVALITTLDSSRELISFSERKEAAVHVAEAELERIQSLPYEEIALEGPPPVCAAPCDQNAPGHYVSGAYYRWDQRPWGETCTAAGLPRMHCEALVVDPAAGAVEETLEERTEAGPSGGVRLRIELQRFVTWVDDDCVKEPPNVSGCTGGADYKRISVAVRIVGIRVGRREGLLNGGPGRPIILSTVVRQGEA